MTTLIIGYGVVGHNLAQEIAKLKPDIYDKYKTEHNTKRDIKYNLAFICVDTPYNEKGYCDLSAVESAIQETDADIIVIKSTILPGTTLTYQQQFPMKKIVFSPEYYGDTQHCNNFKFDFTILGGYRPDCCQVVQYLQEVYDARHKFYMTDSTTAELTKYMENSWLATKVSFCCQFYELANQLGVDYEELRELFLLDERVNPSHTFVYEEHPYWSSHCLNKDVPAIAYTEDAKFLQEVIKYNEYLKEKYKKE